MNFERLSPLEMMSLANLERVHTSILAWILGEDSPLPLRQRANIVAALSGIDPVASPTGTRSVMEYEHIDLLVTVVHAGGMQNLAIEAKLRSNEHSNQLAEYDDILEKNKISPCAKVLLTLDGTLPERNEMWNPISYERLEEVIRREYEAAGKADIYIQDFLQLLERLGWLVRNLDRPECASLCFRSVVQDQDAVDRDPEDAPGLFRYVKRMRLGKILQECWMRRLCARALALRELLPEHWGAMVGETNGAAFLNVENLTRYPGFGVGLQIQGRALKMFSYPVLGPGTDATEEQQTEAATILAEMMVKAEIPGTPTTPRNRGFRSIAIGTAPEERDLAAWGPLVANAITKVVD